MRASPKSTSGVSGKRAASRKSAGTVCEWLEGRVLLSHFGHGPAGHVASPTYMSAHASKSGKPLNSQTPPTGSTTPSQMRHFYGVDNINFAGVPIGNGQGQTIAIVDSYDAPTALSDLQQFDAFYGLADPPSFLRYNQNGQLLTPGGPVDPPTTGPLGNGWQIETSIDVQWAHVIAPAANIVLVESDSPDFADLFQAVNAAAALPGVVCVSMSWGTVEFAGESANDDNFAAPGVVYLASTGDTGTSQTAYPAASPNVVAVGGTSIQFASGTTDGTYGSERVWGGGGGRLSPYELKPAYQNSVLSGTARGTPDVAMDADPFTGVAIYDTFDFGSAGPWAQYGGTSLAAPMWAGLVAITDQGRAGAGLGPLGGSQFLSALYSAPGSGFHDITTGSNGTPATVGYDTATGLGTPVANKLLNSISGVVKNSQLAFTLQPTNAMAGTAVGGNNGVKVSVQDSAGQVITTDSSTVTLTLNGATFAAGGNTRTAQAVNGVATFTGLVINTAGTYTFSASDGSVSPGTSANFTVTPSVSVSLTFSQGPGGTTAGSTLSPVVLQLKDIYGNVNTNDNSSLVSIELASGPGSMSGTTTCLATAGVATFSDLGFTTAGTYTLRGRDGFITSPESASFVINAAAAANLVFAQQPTNTTAGNSISPAVVVKVVDAYNNTVTSVNSGISVVLSSGKFSSGGNTSIVTATSGVATFNGLVINDGGTYTLTASGASVPLTTSSSFAVTVVNALTAGPGANSFTLRRNSDGTHIDWSQGGAIGTIPINDPNGLTLNGDGGNDAVNLNYLFGVPLPNILHLNGTFTVSGLQGATPLANKLIEIGQSTVYFSYGDTSPAGIVQSALAVGFNGGAWNGGAGSLGAITSSAAAGGPAGRFAVGFADSADGIVAGQPAGTIEVRYTAAGDANLDRVVDSTDAILMSRNYNAINTPGWDVGNFNYDSTVDFTDATVLQANYGVTVTAASVVASGATSSQTASTPTSTTVSPAPTSSTSDSQSTSKWDLKRRVKFPAQRR